MRDQNLSPNKTSGITPRPFQSAIPTTIRVRFNDTPYSAEQPKEYSAQATNILQNNRSESFTSRQSALVAVSSGEELVWNFVSLYLPPQSKSNVCAPAISTYSVRSDEFARDTSDVKGNEEFRRDIDFGDDSFNLFSLRPNRAVIKSKRLFCSCS